MNKHSLLFYSKAFTLIEILVGLALSAAIFVVTTSLVVNIFSSSLKSRQAELMEQVKNDLSAEFGNSVRWADSVSFVGGLLQIDALSYKLDGGRLYKGSSAITPEEVEITKFEITKYESQGSAEGSGSGLTSQYFNNEDFTALAFTQKDFNIDFDWGEGSPDDLLDIDTFSVRFTGEVLAPRAGDYVFYVDSDDSARLWVDSNLIIDDWAIPGFSEVSERIRLTEGHHDIRLDYVENFGPARLRLAWSYPGQGKEAIPTVNLFPKSGPVSIKIAVEMRVKVSQSQVDSLSLILSPRSGI